MGATPRPARARRRLPLVANDSRLKQERSDRILPLVIRPGQVEGIALHLTPSWLDLFIDLAVVATLNVFAAVHDISNGASLATFASYIILLQWQWQSIVNYDIRYQTNDWAHRFAKLAQLSVFAFICAFGNNFRITDIHRREYAINDVSTERVDNLYAARAWRGILVAFAAGRLVMCIQYALVLWSRRHRKLAPSIYLPLIAAVVSGAIYLGMSLYDGDSDALRLVLCFGIIAVEMIISLIVAKIDPATKPQAGLLCERQALMTLIIIGEGIIGTLTTFSSIVAGIGFETLSYAYCFCSIVLVAELFLLSFGYLNFKGGMSSFRTQWWGLLHLPLFICTLLLLEAASNSLTYNNLENALQYWLDSFIPLLASIDDPGVSGIDDGQLRKISDNLALIGMSYAELNATFVAIGTSNEEALTAAAYAAFGNVVYKTWQQYNAEISESTTDLFSVFQTNYTPGRNGTVMATQQDFDELIAGLLESIMHSAVYMAPCAGGVLIVTAVLMIMQRVPSDIMGWLWLAPRAIMGLTLALLALLDIGDSNVYLDDTDDDSLFSVYLPIYKWLVTTWLLPGIVLSILGLLAFEMGILSYTMRLYKRQKPLPVASELPYDTKEQEHTGSQADTGMPLVPLEGKASSLSSPSSPHSSASETSLARHYTRSSMVNAAPVPELARD